MFVMLLRLPKIRKACATFNIDLKKHAQKANEYYIITSTSVVKKKNHLILNYFPLYRFND